MPDSHINVFTLGLGGVNVDSDPILTEDNHTLKSQNATYDPTVARAGALTKRMGLDRFNNVPMTGPVLGGIEAPFAGTAGAPASGGGGGGNPGDSGGTTDGQPTPSSGSYGVGPGSSIPGSGGSVSGGSNTGGASIWTLTTGQLFGGKKLIVVGMNDGSTGTGWYVTSKGFNDPAVVVTGSLTGPGPGIPHVPSRLARLSAAAITPFNIGQTCNHDQIVGFPTSVTEGLCARPNGVLFYPQSINPAESTGFPGGSPITGCASPVIRRNDGRSDVIVVSIPPAPSTAPNAVWGAGITTGTTYYSTGHGMQVVGMGTKYGDGNQIYICVHDLLGVGGVTIANDGGRIFRLNVGASALVEIFGSGNVFPLNYVTAPGVPSPFLSGGGIEAAFGTVLEASGTAGQFYQLIPNFGYADNYADWQPQPTPNGIVPGDITCLAYYKGGLYVGTTNTASGSPAAAFIIGPTGSAFTASGAGSPTVHNGFVSMAIFQGNLYASYLNATTAAIIYKFDGTTWSTAFTTVTGTKAAYNLQVDSDGDILYAFGTSSAIATPAWYTTTDGATWVNKSTNMNVANRFPMNIFADFNQ